MATLEQRACQQVVDKLPQALRDEALGTLDAAHAEGRSVFAGDSSGRSTDEHESARSSSGASGAP